jgi:ABC-2 type transport system permease protein
MTETIQTDRTPTPPADAVSRSGSRPIGLIKAELLKLTTTNLWWIIGLGMLAATALALLINGVEASYRIDSALNPPNFGEGYPPGQGPSQAEADQMMQQWREQNDLGRALVVSAANIFTSGQFLGLMFVMFLGTIIVTNEFFHQTATTTFLTTPRRTRVILAKLSAGVALGGAVWLVTTLINLGVGSLIFAGMGQPNSLDAWDVQRAILINLPAYAIWAIFGIGLGVLIRSQIGATIVGLVLYFVGTLVARGAFYIIYQYWITEDWFLKAQVAVPSMASAVMVSAQPLELGWSDQRQEIIYGPQWWVGAVILVGYGIVAGVIGTLITRRRDIS